MTTTTRANAPAGDSRFADRDPGLFGPGSMAWRVHSSPAALFGGLGSLMMEGLEPPIVHLFATQTRNQAGRLKRTIDYVLTTTYGTTEAAEAAGAQIRRVHSHIRGVLPGTTEEIRADDPQWLAWVHNVQIWAYLRSYARFDTPVSPAEADEYVASLNQVAELAGLAPGAVPSTWADLDAYVREHERLELTKYAAIGRQVIFGMPRDEAPNTLFWLMMRIGAYVGFSIMPKRYRDVYDIGWSSLHQQAATLGGLVTTKTMRLAMPYDKAVARLTAQVDAQPFATAARQEP